MDIREETGMAAPEIGVAVGRDMDRIYDLNEEGVPDDNPALVVTKTVAVNESKLEVSYVGADQNGSEDIVQDNLSADKSEYNENGISLLVDVHGSIDGVNESDAGKRMKIRGGGRSTLRKHNGPDDGKGSTVADENDAAGKTVAEKMGGFAVGDFVWGKIKSHPWWPGQIYDPSDASEYALKFKYSGRLLVAYFGDGSCAWCFPSQLVPFGEHFEEMSKQNISKSLDSAVKEALGEIGRRVELKMICSCVPLKNLTGLDRPCAVNFGVKRDVLVPEGDIDRLVTPKNQPAEILTYVRHVGQAGSVTNMLEFVLVKSWLAAFYRAKTGCLMPTFHEPEQIEGLEDKSGKIISDSNEFSVPIEVPIQGTFEEQGSSPKAGPGKGPSFSDEKQSHSRKQKSVAELMAADTVVKPKRQRKQGTPRKLALVESANSEASTKGRKRGRVQNTKISTSLGSESKKGVQLDVTENPLSDETMKNEDSGHDVDGKKSTISRERKRSKYLSPPYTTSSSRKGGKSITKGELETESEKVSKIARMGERMTKASGQLFSSPLSSEGDKKTSKVRKAEEDSSGLEKSASSPRAVKPKEREIINPTDVSASVDRVLAQLRSAGMDLLSLEDGAIEMINGFVRAFRSSLYSNGSNYESYHKQKGRRKRKSLAPESVKANQAKTTSPKSPTQKSSTTERPRSRVTKLKTAARAAATNQKEVDSNASPVSLIISFSAGTPLPSKDEIIKICSNYGNVNKDETMVLLDSNSAQVAYANTTDAEAAFKECIKQSPFGESGAGYSLSYASAAARALESGHKVPASPKKRARKGSKQSGDQIGSIREKLQSLRSNLESSHGKISAEEKSSLEEEIRGLTQTVSALAVKTSP